MVRALALLLLLAPAFAQIATCDAGEVRFDFSASGPLATYSVGNASYPVANLAGYLAFLDSGTATRFLPTQVAGGTYAYRVTCTLFTPILGGGGGTLCGTGTTRCFRISGVSGSPPLDPNTRLYVMVQVAWQIFGFPPTIHAPTFTPLGSLPDNRGLASIPGGAFVTLYIWFLLELSPTDTFPSLPTSGTLTLTYALQSN